MVECDPRHVIVLGCLLSHQVLQLFSLKENRTHLELDYKNKKQNPEAAEEKKLTPRGARPKLSIVKLRIHRSAATICCLSL